MRPFARLVGCALALFATGCSPDEYGILIRAYGDTPGALLAGTTLRVTVQDLETGKRSDPPPTELERDVCTPAADGSGCGGEPAPPDALRIAVELDEPGQLMVHLTASGPAGTFTATRCYSVEGVTESDVLLVGPVGEDVDADADGWPALETCRERGRDDIGCDHQCPDTSALDCLPDDPGGHPGATEQCEDGVDQDCDGQDATCADVDDDGYNGCPPDPAGCCDPAEDECVPGTPRCVDRSACDCDDTNAGTNPGIAESSDPADGRCDNGVDEDCDGRQQRCDDDGDGVVECTEGESGSCDCDDTNDTIFPGAPETPGGECDGLDNNCNELVDEVEACLSDDLDGDGSRVGDDCNDCAASMSPLADTTVCADDIDEDCTLGGTADGRRLPPGTDPCQPGDGDGDGYVGQAGGGTDCDDANPRRHPGAPDDCRDALDADCSGIPSTCASDGDGDGFDADNDCDDSNAAVHPGVDDPCDGADNDCDGVVDEDVPEESGCISSRGAWVEITFASDLQHCGSCRNDCNPGCAEGALCKADGCTEGACTCGGPGGPACDGGDADFCCPDGCRDLTSDALNCGRCGQVCPVPACQVAVCTDGACGTANVPDGTECGGGNFCCDGECRGECAPGTTSEQGCGDCGSQERTCDAECTWGAFGACTAQGACSIGSTDTRPCGDCGDQDRTCQGDCSWGGWGVCYGQGVCTPGGNSQQNCGNCGTQSRSCDDECAWGAYGACAGEGVCAPGRVEQRPCGNCGTQTRTCAGGCTWGAWGACGGEGICAPGQSSDRVCGNCGTQTRTCSPLCAWGAYDACGDEGECAPLASRELDCGDCGSQRQTCDASCTWQDSGGCDNAPARSCNDGQICTADSCNATGDCVNAACGGPTPRCCAAGCFACCVPGDCADPGICRHATCAGGGNGGACGSANDANGTDDCAVAGQVCCSGGCAQCCGANASSCIGDPPGLCRAWACAANACAATAFVPNGQDPFNECNAGTPNCNGAGACI